MSESIGFCGDLFRTMRRAIPKTHLKNMKRFREGLMISRFHISTTRRRQSPRAVWGRSVRRTSSVTIPTAGSSISRARLDEGRTTPPRAEAPRELVEAMRAICDPPGRGAGSPKGVYWLLDQMERRNKSRARCAPVPEHPTSLTRRKPSRKACALQSIQRGRLKSPPSENLTPRRS